MQILSQEIHIWFQPLAMTQAELEVAFQLLSDDEKNRANRFHFSQHRARFTEARSQLRQILSLYCGIAAKNIQFHYSDHGKPDLAGSSLPITFNTSHSHELVTYVIGYQQAVGIDIEKIAETTHDKLAERFFNPQENLALQSLPSAERQMAFYTLWARKEALMKATGQGLSLSLKSFQVSVDNKHEIVKIADKDWHLYPLSPPAEYAGAFACEFPIKNVRFWKFFNHHPQEINHQIF
jgi:4'-phosphopantetheinyl transferase